MTELKQTRKLPRRYKTLMDLKVKDATRKGTLRRSLSSLVSFVRHNFTNYERVLESSLPPRPDWKESTREEKMQWSMECDQIRREVKNKAQKLARQMLKKAYEGKIPVSYADQRPWEA